MKRWETTTFCGLEIHEPKDFKRASPDTSWMGKWAVEEKKETSNIFVLRAIRTLCLFTVFCKVAIQNVLTNNWGSFELSLPKHLIQTLNAKFQNYILILIFFFFLPFTFHIPSLALVGNLGFQTNY